MFNYYIVSLIFLFVACFGVVLGEQSPILEMNPNYFLVKEDPHHRHRLILSGAYELWKQSHSGQLKTFWEFLEKEEPLLRHAFPELYDPHYHMVWLAPEERQPYEAKFFQDEEGNISLYLDSEGIVQEGKRIFVLQNGKFYAATEERYRLHHPSLVAGEGVSSVGTFKIKDGKIHAIAFTSGHYRPSLKYTFATIHALEERGLDLQALSFAYFIEGDPLRHRASYHELMELED